MLRKVSSKSNRWFLMGLALWQVAIASPEDTLLRAEQGRKMKPQVHQKEGELAVEVIPDQIEIKDAPQGLQNLFVWENTNDRIQDPVTFGGAINLAPLGPYDPIRGEVFYVPYIPVPVSEMRELHLGENLSLEIQKILFFEKDGVKYHRFFIHPSRTSSYQDYIKKFGIVRNEFAGFLGGSPRSIYVWNLESPESRIFQVKTSLHWKVNGDLKINQPHKVHRSFFVNDAFSQITRDELRSYNLDFLPESLQAMPRGAATMVREIPNEFLDPRGNKYVPGYYLVSHREENGQKRPPLVLELLEEQLRLNPEMSRDQAAAEILRPVLRTAAFLMFKKGLKGELHEQNIYFELDSNNRPTGKLYVKDLDSFRVDLEVRQREGFRLEAIEKVFKPFVYLKFSQAANWGEKEWASFDQDAYDDMIKKTFGYSFCKVLGCDAARRLEFYRQMDLVLAEEISRVTGLDVNVPRSLRTEVPWVSEVTTKYRNFLSSSLNVESFSALAGRQALFAEDAQATLAQEFARLRAGKRTSSVNGTLDSARTYYVLYDSMIEARYRATANEVERAIGFAAFDDKSWLRLETLRNLAIDPALLKSARRGLSCKQIFRMY
ncbi:MAG: hypothetical protein LW875_11720 [Proteobacteria bacterium]|jgi:hypothetical protein|nr:hypothetical protein [Pseudomonadota bacterium]